MRPIKFRAWDKVNKRMGYFEPGFSWNDEYYLWYLSPDDSVKNNAMICDVPCRDNIILMQFTGLLDKHGKEIFENDILKRHGYKSLSQVVWGLGCWRTRVNTPKGIRDYELIHNCGQDEFESEIPRLHNYEIIGNLFEHPSLLTEVR